LGKKISHQEALIENYSSREIMGAMYLGLKA